MQNQNVKNSWRDRGCALAKFSFRNILSGHLNHHASPRRAPKCPAAQRERALWKKNQKKNTLFKKIAFNAAISGVRSAEGERRGHAFIPATKKKQKNIKCCRTYQRGEKRSPSVINTLADNPCNLPRYRDFQPHLTQTRTIVSSPLRASLNMFVLLLTVCCHRQTETWGLLQRPAHSFPTCSAACLASRPRFRSLIASSSFYCGRLRLRTLVPERKGTKKKNNNNKIKSHICVVSPLNVCVRACLCLHISILPNNSKDEWLRFRGATVA